MLTRIGLFAVLMGLLVGCKTPPSVRHALASPYKPTNVYLRQPTLPAALKRVAVLPLPRSRYSTQQSEGASFLEPVLLDELTKHAAFEVIRVPLDTAQRLTPGGAWSAESVLPKDFLKRLQETTGCDGVLFAELTVYQPYPPLRVGWKARLVDCAERQTWWSVDETFDAGSEGVAVAAEAYAREHLNLPNPLLEEASVLQSPRRFGQYTAWAIAETLPKR